MTRTRVFNTDEKVYIEGPRGCIARLCITSAEFYYPRMTIIGKCSFEQFQEEAKKRGYTVPEKNRPKAFQKGDGIKNGVC
jgi:hypothetical protein